MSRAMLRYLAVFVMVFSAPAAADAPQLGDVAVRVRADKRVQFTLITPKGYVSFAAEGDWPVIAMQSRLPVMVTAFQILDPADDGTSDSTNLAISFFQPGAADAQLAHMRSSHTGGAATKYGAWSIYTRQAMQGVTRYTDIDAEKPCGDVVCGVRLAWPHLAKHVGYDDRMLKLMNAFLDAVDAQGGAYQLRPDDVVRRPD